PFLSSPGLLFAGANSLGPSSRTRCSGSEPCRISTSWAALEPRALQRPSGGEPGPPGLRRARLGLSKRHSASFRSPVPTPKSDQADETNENSLRLEIQELKQKRDALDQEISQLMSEGYVVSELEDHISLLHEYNDIKDVGQMLMGKLASIRGVTTKELYPEFDLDIND
ncbi:DNA repair protein SWI5 homolog, partial [Gracilinanus agilis]|uniref:DNA repair protein SWI5 homolog n=1 Tax=Gracilinanus agilis TaxID=191870 RepID=UPI001CFE8759